MKSFLLLLISSTTFANTFRLPETSSRFSLIISKDMVLFESESLKKRIPIRSCSLPLAKSLNGELLSGLPVSASSEGLKFFVDDKLYLLPSKGSLAARVLMMEPRILSFELEEREACK